MAFSKDQLKDILRRAGWPTDLLEVMAAIGLAESSGDPGATRVRAAGQGQRLPERSYGLWQINTIAHPEYSIASLLDPVNNARAALKLYQERQREGRNGLTHWGSYTDGRYRSYYSGQDASGADPAGAGQLIPASSSGSSGSWWNPIDWFIGSHVAGSQDLYAQTVQGKGSLVTGQQRYLIAVGIIVLVVAFSWSKY